MQIKYKKNQNGFTIIELLIASVAFVSLLILITTAAIQISRIYYNGITKTNTQNAARNVTIAITKSIQFASYPGTNSITSLSTYSIPTPLPAPFDIGWYCVGGDVYMFSEGGILKTSALDVSNLGIVYYSGSCPSITDVAPGGTLSNSDVSMLNSDINASGVEELLSPNMRVSTLSIKPDTNNPNLYLLDVQVTNGADNLLCNSTISPPGSAGSCQAGSPVIPASSANLFVSSPSPGVLSPIRCIPQSSDQFCATIQLDNEAGLVGGQN